MPTQAHTHPEPYRMPIARPPRYACDLGCAVFVCVPLVVASVAMAASNLIHREALIASTLLLLLVGGMFWLALSEGGARKLWINTLGGCSFRQFAEVERDDGGGFSVNFGYVLFGTSFYELRIPAGDVWWVNWQTGQATALAGRDMDDWQVMIWYRDDKAFHRGRSLHTIGHHAARKPTEAFGRRFVDFLQAGGIDFLWDEKESVYARPNAPSKAADRES